jgi:phosphoenolpyruvate synthase/pyruvate phosphate dikinase
MMEVPALLRELDRLFRFVDFASVGTNDLLQLLFAADRSNVRVSSRFDPLSVSSFRDAAAAGVHRSIGRGIYSAFFSRFAVFLASCGPRDAAAE